MVRRRADPEEPSAAPGRKRSKRSRAARGGAFGVRKTVFAIGGMSSLVRQRLAKRLRSELADVRALLEKAELILAPVAGKSGLATSSSSPAAPCGGKDGRSVVAGVRSGGAPLGAGRNKLAKKRKVSFLVQHAEEPKMTPDGRKRLAALMALRSAELHRHGSSGKAEIFVRSMDDASLFELMQQLDKRTKHISSPGHEPMDASAVIQPSLSPSPRQRQADGKVVVVEEDEDVDICGGASPVATALSSLFPYYNELVGATGVNLLSPLQRKYSALAERVDVVSPIATTLPSLLPGYNELVGATGVNLLSLLPHKYVALVERADASPIATTLSSLLPEYSDLVDATGVKTLSPLPRRHIALAEEDEYVDICGDTSPVVILKNLGEIISNNCSSLSSDFDSDSDSSSDSDSDTDSEADEIAGNPAPAVPPNNASVNSAQPSEVEQSAKQETLPEQRAAATSPKPLTDLIAKAQGALARRRQEELAQARGKARQELLEMERRALASNVIHPMDMQLLGIAAVEYMVSSDEEVCRALSTDSVLCFAPRPSCPSVLQKLGLFLKADKEQQQTGFAVDAEDDVEEGLITEMSRKCSTQMNCELYCFSVGITVKLHQSNCSRNIQKREGLWSLAAAALQSNRPEVSLYL
ncbi:hypothetical protein GUJ93_ZPchr0002g24772 [Zizania palustris]|uniref:Uncharacterized protein n=1 Tax=Zizania palustris TaxID=103762 RepID=A0A8J5V4K8_ZIZPA|nr:hypothetical protein GUJ93_ZPchr0002g24772 [Zizania palustris]